MIIGPKRSGKGTLGRVLVELVGAANVCSPSLGSFSNAFPLQPLIGKKFALMSDVRLSATADQKAITEHMLRVSGEDDVNVTRKNKTDWTGRLAVRFMLLTNEVPRLADASGALAGRFIPLVLTNSFFGREDTELTDKLLTELPGILLWALEGWVRLSKQGRFTVPKSSRETTESLERLTSPIKAFVDDRCVVGDDKRVPVDALYAAWKNWSITEGRMYPGTKESFGRDLHAAVPGVRKTRPYINEKRVYCYEGIGLRISKPTEGWWPEVSTPGNIK